MQEMNINTNKITDTMVDLESTELLMELVEQVMAIPEETLNDDNIAVINGMIGGAFTTKMRNEAIAAVLQTFEEQNLTKAAAKQFVKQSKKNIQEGIDELKPSAHKRAILNTIFTFFHDTFNEALAKYHNYVFKLPVKLDEGGKLPTYAHETDACADIYASQDITIPAHSLSNLVHTGLHIALPENWVLMLAPRSSIGFRTGLRLSNSIGIIDEEYRGEIGILYDNFSDSDFEIKAGDRIAQCWVQPVYRFQPVSTTTLPDSDRGEGGFGSTGK